MATKATASDTGVSATGNPYLDTLLRGDKWNKDHAVTFHFDDGAGGAEAWSNAGKDAVRGVLATYSDYIDLDFEEVGNAADSNLLLELNTQAEMDPAVGIFDDPDTSDDQSLGQFAYDWGNWTPWHLQEGGYAYALVLHEVGHGLGLLHPHSTNGLNNSAFPGVDNNGDSGDDGQNNGIYTIMSYLDQSQFWAPQNPPGSDYGYGFQGTPMAFDIAALQHIYGARANHNSGNTIYDLPTVETDGTFWRCIWDTGGNDTIRNQGNGAATIDLRAATLIPGPNAGGYLSRVDIIPGGYTIANGVTIEHAEGGGGADDITGNNAANGLDGNGGNDEIDGLGGNDNIDGGAGNDQLHGDDGGDDIVGGSGVDTIFGGNQNDVLAGGTETDSLYGENGNDVLSGGPGDDTLHGGDGVDIADYFSASGWVHVDLALFNAQATGGAEDTDTLVSIENLGGSNGFADQLRGNANSNKLYGVGGSDTLEGRGGNDILDGGMGLDTASYESAESGVSVNLTNVLPQNTLGAGIDSFISIENLTGSAFADLLLGDFQNNALQGLGGNDWLLGGEGDDSMNGGAGDDLVSGGEGDDNLVGSSGTDTVSYLTSAAAVSVSLATSADQNTGGAGIDALLGFENLHGSSFNDILIGSDWQNTILGGNGTDTLKGGGGADTLDGQAAGDAMLGGDDNDTYAVDSVADAISEFLDEGYDTVNTTLASYTLGDHVERVNSTNGISFIGTGNDGDNRFQSLGGNDRFVDVLGGADIFSGGAGTDTIDFRTSAVAAILNFVTEIHAGAALGDTYSSMEKYLGSDGGHDRMTAGGTGRVIYAGYGGDDRLNGGVKNDQLLGGDGDDILQGYGDRDSLDGGLGNDTLRGGTEADVFVFVDAAFGQDTLIDYEDGLDSLKVFSAVADDISDFTIAGNGTASVTLTLAAAPANTITIIGAAPITIAADDFVFY